LTWLDDIFVSELPENVKSAQIVAALRELADPGCLLPDISRDDFLTSKNIAGAIVKSYRSNAPAWKRYREIEALLKPYVVSYGNSRTVRG
jgi:hypothetical protein